MNTTTTTTNAATTSAFASASASTLPDASQSVQHQMNAVVAFIIGLSIVTLASVLNAAGLNLTKLDHVGPLLVMCAYAEAGLGTHKRDPKSFKAEGLAAPALVTRNATVHVRGTDC
jgi:hypothetical protein